MLPCYSGIMDVVRPAWAPEQRSLHIYWSKMTSFSSSVCSDCSWGVWGPWPKTVVLLLGVVPFQVPLAMAMAMAMGHGHGHSHGHWPWPWPLASGLGHMPSGFPQVLLQCLDGKGSVAMGFVCPDTTPGRLPVIMPGCPDPCKCESSRIGNQCPDAWIRAPG